MDKVFIEALEIECVIGIYDWERKIKQPIMLDIEMAFDNRIPAASDNIEDALDYTKATRLLKEFSESSQFNLLETLAEKCCELMLSATNADRVRIKISKPKAAGALGVANVGVSIERLRR